jgi:hypothetical protein
MKKMKIISDTLLPESKWKKDDIIKIKNKNNKESRFVVISKIIYYGDTIHCEECGKTFTTMHGNRYEGLIYCRKHLGGWFYILYNKLEGYNFIPPLILLIS